MISIGSFLEIFYYEERFNNDGISVWLSIIIGIALTLLLSLAVYKRKEKIYLFLIIPLAAYSIFATSAGQAFSLDAVLKIQDESQVRQEYLSDEIVETQDRINWIDKEVESLKNQISATVETLADRGKWRTTLATAEENINSLLAERKELTIKLSEYRSRSVIHKDVKKREQNIYQFYSKLFNLSENWLQFFLQTILSAFIAAMAPIGIMAYPKKKNHHIKKIVELKIDKNAIQKWVTINWIGRRTGKSNKILSKESYKKFITDRGEEFNELEYDKIRDIALNRDIIQNDGSITIESEKNAINLILS